MILKILKKANLEKFAIILLLGISTFTFSQTTVKGKIVGRDMYCFPFVTIKNLNSGGLTITDNNGRFEILACENDTLEFSAVGISGKENRIVQDVNQIIKIVLIDKKQNCLGGEWSKRKYRRGARKIEKYLKKLYRKAEEEDIWNKESCK